MTNLNIKIEKSRLNNYLDLSCLDLSELPEVVKDFYDTKYLFLNNNNLQNIDLTPFKNLLVLDISDNPIETIDFLPENLEELVCNSCKLKHIVKHNNVKKIHCAFNLLENIEQYPNLIDLECGNNKLNIINTYTNLRSLSCYNNSISEIKEQPNLMHLDCEKTNLLSIDKFTKLEVLDISNTNITSIPYINTLKNIAFTNGDLLLSPNYKIKSYTNYNKLWDIIFYG